MTVNYRPDHAGVAQILRSMGGLVGPVAEQIAANVRAQQPGVDVVVDHYTTDRAAASVTIRDPRALIMQVRDGILTRAAAAAGAEVSSR